jgi:hypothetical protein
MDLCLGEKKRGEGEGRERGQFPPNWGPSLRAINPIRAIKGSDLAIITPVWAPKSALILRGKILTVGSAS